MSINTCAHAHSEHARGSRKNMARSRAKQPHHVPLPITSRCAEQGWLQVKDEMTVERKHKSCRAIAAIPRRFPNRHRQHSRKRMPFMDGQACIPRLHIRSIRNLLSGRDTNYLTERKGEIVRSSVHLDCGVDLPDKEPRCQKPNRAGYQAKEDRRE